MPMDKSESVAFFHDTTQLDGVCSEYLDNGYSEETFSDTVNSMHEESPSKSSAIADANVSSDGPSVDRSVLGWEKVHGKLAIAFFPDFIVYRDFKWSCTYFKVIFFCNCVLASGSNGHEGLPIELKIEDIVDIRSQRIGKTDMIEVKINVIARQQVGKSDGTSSIEELKFCVVDSLWHDKIEEIISLNVKYKALWNFMVDTEVEIDVDTFLSQKTLPASKKCIPKFVENFKEVIYPEGDPDAVSISMREVDMLRPDTFVNDTIIDFYINYLKNTKILPEERPRFHFFNCFFFRKLADMDKDPSSAFDGKAAFLRVRKWTRKVDLFNKDFIFIPVNYSYHWSLIVICHPGEIAKTSGEDAENLTRVPCILHMDSFRGSHANLKDLIQSYLLEEWKERQGGIDEAISSKFLSLRFVPLELPQQQNLFDCGLFLLHYLESFLEARLANFSPFMMKKSELPNFLTSRWFLPDEPYIKRSAIIRLIHGLVNKHHCSGSSEQHCPSNNPKSNNNDNPNALEVIGAGLSLSMDDNNQHMPISNNGPGIEMNLLQTSSFKCPHGVDSGSGLVLREFFDPMSSGKLLQDVSHQALGRTSSFRDHSSGLPSIEEEVEAGLQFVQTATEPGSQHILANDLAAPALLHQSEHLFNHRFSHEEHENSLSFPACNSGGPLYTERCTVVVTSLDDHKDHPIHEARNAESSTKPEADSLDDHIDHPNYVSVGNTESCRKRDYPSGVTEGISGSPSCMINHHDSADNQISFLKNLPVLSLLTNESCVQEGGGITDNQLESQHPPPTKKVRLMFSLDMDNSATTLPNDLHL